MVHVTRVFSLLNCRLIHPGNESRLVKKSRPDFESMIWHPFFKIGVGYVHRSPGNVCIYMFLK